MNEGIKMIRLMYRVEITCTPSSIDDKDLAMKGFRDLLKYRQPEVVDKTACTLFYLGIRPVDLSCMLTTSLNKINEKLYMTASISGRGLSNDLYDFEFIKEQVIKNLSKEYSFKPGELSVNVYLRKINLLTYRIEFLKGWYNYAKHVILKKFLTS